MSSLWSAQIIGQVEKLKELKQETSMMQRENAEYSVVNIQSLPESQFLEKSGCRKAFECISVPFLSYEQCSILWIVYNMPFNILGSLKNGDIFKNVFFVWIDLFDIKIRENIVREVLLTSNKQLIFSIIQITFNCLVISFFVATRNFDRCTVMYQSNELTFAIEILSYFFSRNIDKLRVFLEYGYSNCVLCNDIVLYVLLPYWRTLGSQYALSCEETHKYRSSKDQMSCFMSKPRKIGKAWEVSQTLSTKN